jgi:ABC-type glycerol-3-phosphate transport system substrate-binding protein
VLFLTGRENQATILQTGFALPSLRGFESDPFFQGSGTLNRISRILYEGASYGVSREWGGAANPRVQRALDSATERALAGMQTSREALDQACQEIDEALAAR